MCLNFLSRSRGDPEKTKLDFTIVNLLDVSKTLTKKLELTPTKPLNSSSIEQTLSLM